MEIVPRPPTAKGPAEWFTGDVWIDAIGQGHGPSPVTLGVVHFTPGARTAWHAHTLGQTLWVTAGQGLLQSRGGPVVAIRAGDVTFTPGEEWHWHGAAPGNSMTHVTMAEGGAEWGEHVTDAEYGGAS